MKCNYPVDPGGYYEPPEQCGDDTYGAEFCAAHEAVLHGDPDAEHDRRTEGL